MREQNKNQTQNEALRNRRSAAARVQRTVVFNLGVVRDPKLPRLFGCVATPVLWLVWIGFLKLLIAGRIVKALCSSDTDTDAQDTCKKRR